MKAYKIGICDGLLGRECKNPYNWKEKRKMLAYQAGYSKGKELRLDNNITLTIEDDRL